MPPVTKCDIGQGNPNFDWLFTPSASDLTGSAHQRSEYCDNSNYMFSAPHSYSHRLTSKILHNREDTSSMHHSTSANSSKRTVQASDTELLSTSANSYSTATHNANLHSKEEFSKPVELSSSSFMTSSPLGLSPEIQRKKIAIGNTTMKFLHQIGATIVGRRKHVLSNFDMNAISPTSW